MHQIAAILLAAGESKRMGHDNKLLLPIAEKKIINYALDALTNSEIAMLLVVLGYQAEEIRAAIDPSIRNIDGKIMTVKTIIARDWQSGMGNSLAEAVQALPEEIDAALIFLADMPAITNIDINRLIAHVSPKNFIIPTYQGKKGHPVLVPKIFFPSLMKLNGDKGARQIIEQNPHAVREIEFSNPAILYDIDDADTMKEADNFMQ